MLHVSIFVEGLRSQPRLMFWLAALVQAAIWWLVPTIFYAAPPGDLPMVLAVGHEFQLGTDLGPPLAFWLAESVYMIAGLVGVYLLSQVCVVVTYWAVFELGRVLVGPQQAAIAVLLMLGITVMTVPSPDFGPAVLGMALAALMMLHFWRAIGEGQRH
jgi:4-amino-4-deoxy-L-arabinose transferase-like glycosyltransferase